MANLLGKQALIQLLATKKTRAMKRYDLYEMKYSVPDFNMSTPPALRSFFSVLGWCGKSVDSLADRLVVYGLKNDNFDMQSIFDINNPDVLFDSAILSALITSCSFLYISKDEAGLPRLQVIDGCHATGVYDPTTGMLKEGYAVLDTDKYGNTSSDAYFLPGVTYFKVQGDEYAIHYETKYPLLVPVIYKSDAKRPFGHSRISRAQISLMEAASRTVKRSEISAEFYSVPQKYILGTSPNVEMPEKWSMAMSALWNISMDEKGNKPTVGQFTQQSMAPYIDQLKMIVALFAGETGLTNDDLGFVLGNPSSVEAIKASHENLRLAARKAQRCFATGFINAGYLAACVRDKLPYLRSQVYQTKMVWEPIFEPDASMLSAIGDGAIKTNQAVPGYFGKNNLRELTGIEAEE